MIEWGEYSELKKVTLLVDAIGRIPLSQQQMLTAIESILSNNNLCISDVGLIVYTYSSKVCTDILDFALEHAIKTTKVFGNYTSVAQYGFGYDNNDELIMFDYKLLFIADHYYVDNKLKGIKNLYVVDTKNEYKIIY